MSTRRHERRHVRMGRLRISLSAIVVFAAMIGISLGFSFAKEVAHEQMTIECAGLCAQNMTRHPQDARLIRHLHHRVQMRGASTRPVFAATESEAEQKILQRQIAARGILHSPSEDRALSPEWAGLCQEKLSPTERELITAALAQLRLPEERSELSVYRSRNEVEESSVKEAAHRVIQTILGDSRYRAVFRECMTYQTEEGTSKENRRRDFLYRALGLTSDQQARMTLLVEQTLRRMYPTTDPSEIEREEEGLLHNSMLDEHGVIPALHPTPMSTGLVDNSIQSDSTWDQNDSKKAEVDFSVHFYNLLTDEQRAFLAKYGYHVIPPGSYLFDPTIDALIETGAVPKWPDERTSGEY